MSSRGLDSVLHQEVITLVKKRMIHSNKPMDPFTEKRASDLVDRLIEERDDDQLHVPITFVTDEDLAEGRDTCPCLSCRAHAGEDLPPETVSQAISYLADQVATWGNLISGFLGNDSVPDPIKEQLKGVMYGIGSLHIHFRDMSMIAKMQVESAFGEDIDKDDLLNKLQLLKEKLMDMEKPRH